MLLRLRHVPLLLLLLLFVVPSVSLLTGPSLCPRRLPSWPQRTATTATSSFSPLFSQADSALPAESGGGSTNSTQYKISKIDSLAADASAAPPQPLWQRLWKVVAANWLVLGEVFVILLAQKNPSLGATGGPLKPELFISKLGVFTIFFINGVALSLSKDPSQISSAGKTNALIQVAVTHPLPLPLPLPAHSHSHSLLCL